MVNHFEKGINLKELILKTRPKHIVECGAGQGDHLKLLLSLMDEVGFKLTSISDNDLELDPKINKIVGVSYKMLNGFEDNSIDLCIIDTDHNYWTLVKELEALKTKISENGRIVMHDVATFWHNSGMALSYSDNSEYPKDEIQKMGLKLGGLGNAIIDFLTVNRLSFRIEKYLEESHGAMVLRKKTLSHIDIETPGKEAVFAQPSGVL